MVLVQRIHHEFKIHYNKLNSNHKRDLPPAYIDDLINRAFLEYIDIFATGTNAKKFKIGFEVTQQRTEMLNNLVITDGQVIPLNIDTDSTEYHIYEYEVPKDYHYHLKSTIKTNCGEFSLSPKQHDDINTIVRSHLTKPSIPWRRIPTLIAKSSKSSEKSFYIFVPVNLVVQNFKLTYIKKPDKVFIGGYDTLEYIYGDLTAYNATTSVVHCEIEEDYLHVLIDIMVDIMSRILSDTTQIQSMQDKLINQY